MKNRVSRPSFFLILTFDFLHLSLLFRLPAYRISVVIAAEGSFKKTIRLTPSQIRELYLGKDIN